MEQDWNNQDSSSVQTNLETLESVSMADCPERSVSLVKGRVSIPVPKHHHPYIEACCQYCAVGVFFSSLDLERWINNIAAIYLMKPWSRAPRTSDWAQDPPSNKIMLSTAQEWIGGQLEKFLRDQARALV